MIKIIDLYAPWCQPCKVIASVLDELEKELNIEVQRVNIDEDIDVAEYYQVRSIPTLIFFKDNIQVLKTTGSKTKEQLKVIINKINNGND